MKGIVDANDSMMKNILLAFISLAIALIGAECALRSFGQKPGQLRASKWLTEADSLYLYDGFLSDENGIFKVDTSICRKIEEAYYEVDATIAEQWYDYRAKHCVPELPLVYFDHYGFFENHNSINELSSRFEAITTQGAHSVFDSIVAEYHRHPINEDGFYSIPFDAQAEGKTKILLLGDSFTWGHSAQNKTGSFANTMLAREFLVFNTGISGADVAQYQKITEVYLDDINPDVVVLNFYMGNDISYFQRTPTRGIPIHFNSNAGNLVSFQDGVEFYDAQSAYDNIMRNCVIPKTTLINRLLSTTVLSTLVWRVLVRLRIVHHDFFIAPPKPETPFCNMEIKQIMEICKARNMKFILSVIPDLIDERLCGSAFVPHLFDGIPYHEPQMNLDMFSLNDGHFNDKGHLFYADYLEKLILAETK